MQLVIDAWSFREFRVPEEIARDPHADLNSNEEWVVKNNSSQIFSIGR